MNKYMAIAIEEARDGIRKKQGGPFGCCIVKDGKVIAANHNRVLQCNDPTCHGEIDAIREAASKIDDYDLSGCELYTTGEPCPMCLCACLWAKIDKIYYGCTIEDNADIGFKDEEFTKLFNGREKLKDYLVELDRDECLKLFDEYKKMDKELY